jgi:hypothetical protein
MSYWIPRLSRKTHVFILNVQWVANPLCTYTLYCVPYIVFSELENVLSTEQCRYLYLLKIKIYLQTSNKQLQ